MKVLHLLEDDKELFDSQVNRSLYVVYRDHIENFTFMFEQQGPGYWLKFCITLRSFMQKQGYNIHLAAIELDHFEEYFIFLAKLLTDGNVESVHTYVKDVVSVSRFHQLMYNVPNAFVSKESQLTPSFKRLFGIASEGENIIKMVGTLPLHLRAVGCLLLLLERWPKAQNKIDKPWWRPPQSWHYGNHRKASHFEVFLKKHWGEKLLTLINVKASDICWWKVLPQAERMNTIEERNTALGRCISKTSKELNLPIVGSIAVVQEPLLFCKFFNTAPRGKFIFFWNQASAQIFIFDTFRELYFIDYTAAMHPFSQIIISFTNAAFSQEFIFGGEGVETQFHSLMSRELGCHPPHEIQKGRQTINFLLKILGQHVIKADMAIHLNANFHSSLFRHDDWTDPIILTRFLWNLPLLLSWLEILLIKIYEFQRYFLPFCHFPVRKKTISSFEILYRRMSEATYLTKSCIIIVETVMRREHKEAGRCYEARKLICSVIPVLAKHKVFLEEDAYRTFDGILKVGWNKDEREDGECCPLIEDRVKINLNKWDTVPDIESYYSENFRHIYYWVSTEKWPDIEGSVQYYSEAMEMLKDYKVGSKQPYKETTEPYNFSKFRDFIKDMNLTELYSTETGEKMGFASLVIRLLEEDGWLCSDAEEKFWFLFDSRFSIRLRHFKDEEIMRGGLPDSALTYLEFIQNHGAAYYITACVLGDTWKSEIAGQNSLARLHRSESLAYLADLGARISYHVQQLNRKVTACPPHRCFKEAAETIANITENKKSLSIDKVKSVFEFYGKLELGFVNMNRTGSPVLDPLIFPELEDMQSPGIGLKWLAYVERRREAFLQLVSDKQFEVTKNVSKKHIYTAVCLFPQYDILDHRLMEEMAAMQKCLELGGMFYGAAYGLCRLITHRFHWLQNCFIAWKNKSHEFMKADIPKSTSALLESLITIRINMLATYIPLQALFLTYVSQYKTTHPITEMTIDMLFDWADSARIWCTEDKTNIMLGSCLGDYVKALQTMGCEYMETLLVQCKSVWVVSPFISNPELDTIVGSLDHVQQILSTFTQLFLMSFYTILTRIPEKTSYMKLADTLTNEIINVRMRLRKAELEDTFTFNASWPNTRQSLKSEFRSIWSNLLEFRKFLCGTVPSKPFPQWHDNSLPIWREYFSIFVSSHYRNILQKISFSDFINIPNPGPDTNMKKESKQNKKKAETKTSAINETYVEESKRKKNNNKDNGSVEPLIYQLSITQIESKDNCLVVSREMTVIERHEREEIEDLSMKEKAKHNTQTGKKAKGKRKTYIEDDLQHNPIIEEEDDELVNHKNSEKSRDDENAVTNKLKTCMYCKNVEPTKRTYKKCALCKKEGWLQPRFYCSSTCQVKDWRERHNMEHKNGMQQIN